MTLDDRLPPLSPVGKVRRLEIDRVADLLARVRSRRPHIHVLTSALARSRAAAAVLAIGAEVSTTAAAEEIPAFVAAAEALMIDLDDLDRPRRDAALTAVEVAKDAGVPWLLEAAGIDVAETRLAFARRLIEMEPELVRLDRDAFRGLFGADADEAAIREHAVHFVSTLAVTGEVDVVTDGTRTIRVANGHPLMARVPAMGPAGFAVATAFRAVEPDPVVAGAAALVALGVAGEVAAASAHGPGSLEAEFLDALAALDEETLRARAKIG